MTLQARYTIRRKIADGGTAEIFLATQHGAYGFEKTVVLKRIFQAFYADPQFRNMLVDEAHIAMSLNHSNIVQVLDLGEADGQYVLALELVDGWTLDSVLRRARALDTALPPALALYVTAEVCRALAYAHAKTDGDGKPLGIVHCDTSPHNVLLSEQGEVKLTDFGIATARNRRESSLGNIIKGKIAYMSPEQASGGILDARSDLFSVGTMLYVMICRRYPFDAQTDLEVLLLVKKGECVPPEIARRGLNPEIYRVLNRAMAKAPGDRYQRAEDMLVDVEQVMRVAFRPVGQTELKRWLQDLSTRDGAPPLTRAPASPTPARDAEGEGLELQVPDAELAPPTPAGLPPPSQAANPRLPTPSGVSSDLSRKSRPPPPPAALAVGKRAGSHFELSGSIPASPEPTTRASVPAKEPHQPKTDAESGQIAPADSPVELPPDESLHNHSPPTDAGERVPTQSFAEATPPLSAEPDPNHAVPDKIIDSTTGGQVARRTRSSRIVPRAPALESALAPPTPRRSSSWVAEAVLASAQRAGTVAPPPVGPVVPPPVRLPPASLDSNVFSAPTPLEPGRKTRGRSLAIWTGIGMATLLVAAFSFRACARKSGGRHEARLSDVKPVMGTPTASGSRETPTAPPSVTPSASPQNRAPSLAPGVVRQDMPSAPDATVPGGDTAERTGLASGPEPGPASSGAGANAVAGAPGSRAPMGAPAGPGAESGADSSEPADNPSAETGGDSGAILANRRVSVFLRSSPPGALVGTAHRSFGVTPVSARFKIGRAYAVIFMRDGYAPVTKHFRPTGDANQEVVATFRKPAPPSAGDEHAVPPTRSKAEARPWFQRMFGR
jgi:serine/threonine protein kinase